MKITDEALDRLHGIYRQAIAEAAESDLFAKQETLAQMRARCERAGLVAVIKDVIEWPRVNIL